MKSKTLSRRIILAIVLIGLALSIFLILAVNKKSVLAQTNPSVLYVPLIGLTSVPVPLALPNGSGNVTYHYAVKNFLSEVALTDVHVADDKCRSVKFITGDDNGDSKLDYNETWRYICTAKLSRTTQSTATATGATNNITSTDKAYATVVVGSNNSPPLVSIINITKVAYPLSLPSQGGKITFTYKVNNPGVVPLSDVKVVDNKCSAMSGKLGDTNGNNLLDINEVWIYTCAANLTQTTTNTVNVTAYANGLKAVDNYTITVKVDTPVVQSSPSFPDAGVSPNFKIIVWEILVGVLTVLIVFFVLSREIKRGKIRKKPRSLLKAILIVGFIAGVAGVGYYILLVPQNRNKDVSTASDKLFGWKFPVAKFPSVGSTRSRVAYSDIRDPGGLPTGLPVRLKVPIIGVNSAIEDAFITSDGRMDVPAGSVNVAWFALGPHPGQIGSAVIGGHFGIDNGIPKVFYNLDKLKIGDKVYIEDDKGDTLAFIVRSISLFDRNADATTVFTSGDGLAHLNLITCEGVWNQVNDSYPLRRIVFTDAIPSEGEVVVVKPKIATKSILSPTQIPTVLPPSPPKVLTAPPSSGKKSSISPQILILSAKSLYATPIDGLITSFLLVSIALIFKIIRRKHRLYGSGR